MDIISTTGNFFKSRFNLGLFIALVLIAGILIATPEEMEPIDYDEFAVHYFFLPNCPH